MVSWNWGIEQLESEALRPAALEQARDADLIFCALAKVAVLPPEAAAWFRELLTVRTDHPRALVMLHCASSGLGLIELPSRGFLEDICRRGQMDFYAHACTPRADRKVGTNWMEICYGSWRENLTIPEPGTFRDG